MEDFARVFDKMIGGNSKSFLRDYWRKQVFLARGALPFLERFYSCSEFWNDLTHYAKPDLVLSVELSEDGTRLMRRLDQLPPCLSDVKTNMSIVLQGMCVDYKCFNLPAQWLWFRNLYQFLWQHLLPTFPQRVQSGGAICALDMFLTTGPCSVGGHYDTGDVFYFVLEGEKEWSVELIPDLELALSLAIAGTNYTVDRKPSPECSRITLYPGDCLYVPPFTYHRVCSHGASLGISVGLPAFSELTLLRAAFNAAKADPRMLEPLPSYPLSDPVAHEHAITVTVERLLKSLGLTVSLEEVC